MENQTRYRATTLKAVLASRGIKANWVAEKAEISRFLMSHVVNGRRTVNHAVGEKISDALDMPFFVLFEVSPDAMSAPIEAEAIPA